MDASNAVSGGKIGMLKLIQMQTSNGQRFGSQPLVFMVWCVASRIELARSNDDAQNFEGSLIQMQFQRQEI